MKIRKVIIGLFVAFNVIGIGFAQIQAGKAINITISNVPEGEKAQVNGIYPVSDSGMINMTGLGQVRAAGLRQDQLAEVLQSMYKRAEIYTNPTIQVVVTSEGANVNQETVTLGGDIRKPGPIPFTKGLTLWEAIQAAGGVNEFGSEKRVTVTRGGKQKTYDLKKPEFKAIPLYRNDTIEIPRKNLLGG